MKHPVDSPLSFRTIVRIERSPARTAILVPYVPREQASGLIRGGRGENKGTVLTSLQLSFTERVSCHAP